MSLGFTRARMIAHARLAAAPQLVATLRPNGIIMETRRKTGMLNVTGAARIDASAILERQRTIAGYFLDESAAIWCFLLQEQHVTWSWEGLTSGDYLEIGVFKGKSASVLAEYARLLEIAVFAEIRVILPDAAPPLDGMGAGFDSLPIRSEHL